MATITINCKTKILTATDQGEQANACPRAPLLFFTDVVSLFSFLFCGPCSLQCDPPSSASRRRLPDPGQGKLIKAVGEKLEAEARLRLEVAKELAEVGRWSFLPAEIAARSLFVPPFLCLCPFSPLY